MSLSPSYDPLQQSRTSDISPNSSSYHLTPLPPSAPRIPSPSNLFVYSPTNVRSDARHDQASEEEWPGLDTVPLLPSMTTFVVGFALETLHRIIETAVIEDRTNSQLTYIGGLVMLFGKKNAYMAFNAEALDTRLNFWLQVFNDLVLFIFAGCLISSAYLLPKPVFAELKTYYVLQSVTIGMISVVAMVVVEAALVIMEVMPIVIFANVGFAAMNAIASNIKCQTTGMPSTIAFYLKLLFLLLQTTISIITEKGKPMAKLILLMRGGF
ncbi:4415_t:CDS:2 [Paraglomus brasilianum]|uniref:4415_t:CDS:1 n=1 Tax=Paraglomus brasilianum TaxID=144538 RepID=A0A9N9FFP9_9GLOM|nr:4415_t:CDS:2 [Paraglomus brasilianum]